MIRPEAPELPRLFFSRLRYIPGIKAVYFINPKVACSLVLASMWRSHDETTGRVTFAGNAHAGKPNPFVEGAAELKDQTWGDFLSAPFFSIVRNPYVRFVSAFLDKAARRSDTEVWRRLSRTLGLPFDQRPVFSKFLDAIATADR